MNTDMELNIKTNLGLIIFAASLVTPYIGISDVNAIFPFDEFMTPKTDEPKNQSSENPFKNGLSGSGEHGLSGEHGESSDEQDTDSPFD